MLSLFLFDREVVSPGAVATADFEESSSNSQEALISESSSVTINPIGLLLLILLVFVLEFEIVLVWVMGGELDDDWLFGMEIFGGIDVGDVAELGIPEVVAGGADDEEERLKLFTRTWVEETED